MASLVQPATRRLLPLVRQYVAELCTHSQSLPVRACSVANEDWFVNSCVEAPECAIAKDGSEFRVEQVVLDAAVDHGVSICRVHLHSDCLQAEPSWDSLQVNHSILHS